MKKLVLSFVLFGFLLGYGFTDLLEWMQWN